MHVGIYVMYWPEAMDANDDAPSLTLLTVCNLEWSSTTFIALTQSTTTNDMTVRCYLLLGNSTASKVTKRLTTETMHCSCTLALASRND